MWHVYFPSVSYCVVFPSFSFISSDFRPATLFQFCCIVLSACRVFLFIAVTILLLYYSTTHYCTLFPYFTLSFTQWCLWFHITNNLVACDAETSMCVSIVSVSNVSQECDPPTRTCHHQPIHPPPAPDPFKGPAFIFISAPHSLSASLSLFVFVAFVFPKGPESHRWCSITLFIASETQPRFSPGVDSRRTLKGRRLSHASGWC